MVDAFRFDGSPRGAFDLGRFLAGEDQPVRVAVVALILDGDGYFLDIVRSGDVVSVDGSTISVGRDAPRDDGIPF